MTNHTHPFDDQLRQKEEQQLPDLSALETHLERFRQQQLAVGHTRRHWRKVTGWTAALIGLFGIGYQMSKDSKKLLRTTSFQFSSSVLQQPPQAGSLAEEFSDSHDEKRLPLSINKLPDRAPANHHVRSQGFLLGRGQSESVKKETLTLNQPVPAALAQWLDSAKKKATPFIIDNDRDTLLLTVGGSAFFIPALSFPARGPVLLQIREFYSPEEMLIERLHTRSDGQLLETGGMVHIAAFQDGQPVPLQPGRSIRWFIKQQDDLQNMQLFKGLVAPKVAANWVGEVSNWKPSEISVRANPLSLTVNAIDFRLEPSRIRYGKKTRATVFIARSTKVENDVLRDSVLIRHPQIDRLKIRRMGKRKINHARMSASSSGEKRSPFYSLRSIGDTVRMTMEDAIRYRLPAIDTFLLIGRNYQIRSSAGTYPANLLEQMKNRMAVDILELGWINCDRFYNDPRPRVEVVVVLPASAADYVTAIVFRERKTILYGQRIRGNQVHFGPIPVGEKINIISFGVGSSQLLLTSSQTVVEKNYIHLPPFEVVPSKALRAASAAAWNSDKDIN